MTRPIWVCYGGGTDSTAMLIRMVLNKERIDLITFADTGAELPHTYQAVRDMHFWLLHMGYPGIRVVRYETRDGRNETLEQSIIKNQTVPSLAFGWHTCSIRFKIDPQVKYAKTVQRFIDEWANGGRVTRCIGYDFSPADKKRSSRSTTKFPDLDLFENRYPLQEWQWNRERCLEEILSIGFIDPKKSSCYFCPAMKKHEILNLRVNHPEYYKKAIAIEQAALDGGKLETVLGLGRNYAWKDV